MKSVFKRPVILALLGSVLFGFGSAGYAEGAGNVPIVIQGQGSFAVGGKVKTEPGKFDPTKPMQPAGQTYHGDHAYVSYQIPVKARALPIVMWHGAGQFSKTWESTPDGREGFQTIFLRRGFATYLIDQPRRGNAGRSMVEATIKPVADEQMWFNQFRVGVWPDYFSGVQFPRDEESLNQYFRAMTPNTGAYDPEVISDAVSALFDRIGGGILFTHSQSGGPGWLAAIKNPKIKAVVAFEPGSAFVFPEGEAPAPIPNAFDIVAPVVISKSAFDALTRIPIVIYYGDNIPEQPVALPAQDSWRARLAMARLFRDTVNRHGGRVTLIHLPEIGIRGNTHFPFADLNNLQIADQVSAFLKDNHLDQ
jgi:hypothetical protein